MENFVNVGGTQRTIFACGCTLATSLENLHEAADTLGQRVL